MKHTYISIFFFTLLLSSCADGSTIPTIESSILVTSSINMTSSSSEGSPIVFNDYVAYGSNERHVLEYAYLRDRNQPSPMVLLLHGGAWVQGDKAFMRPYMNDLVQAGYVYVSMNYQLITTSATYLNMLQDIHLAIRFLKQNASSLNLDTGRMAIAGESAGGHLSLLYGYREISPIPIEFIFTLVPPLDLLDPGFLTMPNPNFQLLLANGLTGSEVQDAQTILSDGYPPQWMDASPITHMNRSLPTFIAYAGLDELIPPSNVERLLEKVSGLDFPIETMFFPDSSHNLNLKPSVIESIKIRLYDYLETYLG
jgi:acetyl esterase/lipase